MVFARDARSKKTYWDWHVVLRPLKGLPFKKTKVSTLGPSLTVLVENNKGQNQRNNNIVFLASRVWNGCCQGCTFKETYLDGNVDIRPLKGIPSKNNHPTVSTLKPSLIVLVADKTNTPEKNDQFVGLFSRIQVQKRIKETNIYIQVRASGYTCKKNWHKKTF